ncbi:signal recognition particle protein [Parvularcula bermudensis HTCC2503]|uniref:Signal recognition particle protein n=1 Tax=Parvularcula bermudensis (strain ATCC BAA-594 / HTCC2503 / KCTC 12087) TaxID=314260 RepID=E0TF54_PARBH|nr:signal recognition particle protein [Parvularcula bermudensis]ADM08972.1 signal recognition particle protein [Parvularcula bermudensis HTCC2503]
MFDTLSDRLSGVFEKLRGRGALTEKDVSEALREVRVALLEADVALPVARDFVGKVKERAIGQEVLRSVTPGQQVVKIVHDVLVDTLGGGDNAHELDLTKAPPSAILMVGLQGSGKTTTSAKLAKRLKEKDRKRVLMASLDTRRPAAMEQLKVLGEQADVPTLPIVPGQSAVQIAGRAMEAARLGGHDIVILDTAGRLSIDEELMAEVKQIHTKTSPVETLLVLDSLTGQDAVQTAERFKARVPVSGVVLTRLDGDGRGGAALSMRSVTGAPIKFAGVGEKLDALDVFDPERMAGRILGMGDIVSLVEKASQDFDEAKAKQTAQKLAKGEFDLDDLREQLAQMRKMGGMGTILGLMPGMGKIKDAESAAGGFDDGEIKRQEAIISSMTKKERRKPDLMNASRKRRVAKGAGVQVQDVNKLLKAHRGMADMMKKMGKGGKRGMAGQMAKMLGGGMPGGGMPPGLTGPGAGGLPGLGGGMPPDLSQLPGLPGTAGKKKK